MLLLGVISSSFVCLVTALASVAPSPLLVSGAVGRLHPGGFPLAGGEASFGFLAGQGPGERSVGGDAKGQAGCLLWAVLFLAAWGLGVPVWQTVCWGSPEPPVLPRSQPCLPRDAGAWTPLFWEGCSDSEAGICFQSLRLLPTRVRQASPTMGHPPTTGCVSDPQTHPLDAWGPWHQTGCWHTDRAGSGRSR